MAVVFGRVQGMSVMKAFASNAERLGFSTLWAPENVVLVDQYNSRYPYRDEGTFPAPTDAPIADPFLTLSFFNATTTTDRYTLSLHDALPISEERFSRNA